MHKSNEQSIKVLLADDSNIVREILTDILEEKYTISFASDGEEALQKYKDFRPDVIILDLHMPSIGGLEVIEYLRNDFQDQNVYLLVVTGETSFKLKKEALNKGANDYLIKPYNSEELLARVGVAERQIKLQKQLRQAFSEIEQEIEMLGDIQSRLLPRKRLDQMDIDVQSYFKP
ncbi:MAG: response regulator, partial [Thermodesulfobacteriota bacterium]